MDLAVDIGNTFTKLAVFAKEELLHTAVVEDLTQNELVNLMSSYPEIKRTIISSVKELKPNIVEFLGESSRLLLMDENTRLPFNNLYETPETLGKDRIAAVAGAAAIFPEKNVLVIDAGTCITYDLLTNKLDYLGGAISPGIAMRFKSLNTFTGKLPLIEHDPSWKAELIGKTTEGSIRSGVQLAVLSEVEGIIGEYARSYSPLRIVVTGGDLFYFDKYLKSNIFAAPNLVLIGLKKILNFNDEGS